MHPLDLELLVPATGGTLRGDLPVDTRFRSIERDARRVEPGDLFIAIAGERFDGHAFVADAAARGASAALVRRAWAEAHPEVALPLIIVDDEPVNGLQRLAGWWRSTLPVRVVGITGSVGKTSAKEVAAAVLAQRFQVYKSPGNLNNEIGLPLSLLEITPEIDIAVLEMGGAYAFGDLALLCDVARPNVGMVINVHPVHLERMGTIEAIAETKAELVDGIPADGVVILNADDPRVAAMAARTSARVVTYGMSAGAEVRASNPAVLGMAGAALDVEIDGERRHVATPMVGEHVPMLGLSAIAVGHAFGMTLDEMLPAFRERSVQVRVQFVPGPRGSMLIDDTYNASTPSVLSSLGVLEAFTAERKIAVLGDMREMGSVSEAEHRTVGRRVAEVADALVTFGSEARFFTEEVEAVDGRCRAMASFAANERDALAAFLAAELRAGDVALLKGSRGLQMEDVVAHLTRLASERA